MAQIIEIDRFRTKRNRERTSARCYCDAARAARAHFASEIEELRLSIRKPDILILERLDGGIPSLPQGWDFICSAGLFTGLPAAAACQVVKTAASRLKAGGRLLIANVRHHAALERCPACQTMSRNHRGEIEMVELASDIALESVTGQVIFPDAAGMNIYLELHKSPFSLQQPQLVAC